VNPVTRAILMKIRDRQLPAFRDLERFVDRWDALEALVIRVYRAGEVSAADEGEYRSLRAWLARHYPRWQGVLQPYWQQARIAGESVQQDPFLALWVPSQAAGFVGDWAAMQRLPAAREALNRFLVDYLQGLSA
jgi:hypothetical protein